MEARQHDVKIVTMATTSEVMRTNGNTHFDDDITNEVNSTGNSFHFTELDSSADLLANLKKISFKCRRSNILVEDGIQESPRFCQRKLQNQKYGLYCHLKKYISFAS